MKERYTKLANLPRNQYLAGAPVILVAGTLLQDQAGQPVLRLKMRNLSDCGILDMRLGIRTVDAGGNQRFTDYFYADLAANTNETFAQKEGIPLPPGELRGCCITVKELTFADQSVWRNERMQELAPLEKQQTLEQALGKKALADQYRRESNPAARFRPVFARDYWQCACAAVNSVHAPQCCRCGGSREALERLEDAEVLSRDYRTFRRDRKRFLQQNGKRRTWTAILLAVLTVLVAALLILGKVENSRREAQLKPYLASAFEEYRTMIGKNTDLIEGEDYFLDMQCRSQKIRDGVYTIEGTFTCRRGDRISHLPFTLTGQLGGAEQELALGQDYLTDAQGRRFQ